jgi:uncharacterized protein (TIRG00374 family)
MVKSRRTWLRWLAAGVGLALVAFFLRGRLPSPADVFAALHLADPGWLVVAGVAELISMAMFGRQQRRMLTAYGVTMNRRRSLALAYSRSAISIAVPAGSAVSAAYAFRQFRSDGASRAAATAVMVLSGLISLAGLVLIYVTGAAGAGLVRLAEAWRTHPEMVEGTVALFVAITVLVVALAWPTPRKSPHRVRTSKLARRAPKIAALLGPVAEAVASSRSVPARHWLLALGAATVNWLTDMLCLVAAAKAFHLPLGLIPIAAVYLTVQIVRQIPLTPGGIGVIEVSLLAGLISAGAGYGPATATVLLYRLLSCWLILPAGLLGWLVLRRPVTSDPVARALPDDGDLARKRRARLGQDRLAVAARGHVGEQQSRRARPLGQLARLGAGHVQLGWTVIGVRPGSFGEQHVDAGGEVGQPVERTGIAGVGDRAAA